MSPLLISIGSFPKGYLLLTAISTNTLTSRDSRDAGQLFLGVIRRHIVFHFIFDIIIITISRNDRNRKLSDEVDRSVWIVHFLMNHEMHGNRNIYIMQRYTRLCVIYCNFTSRHHTDFLKIPEALEFKASAQTPASQWSVSPAAERTP